MELAKTAFM